MGIVYGLPALGIGARAAIFSIMPHPWNPICGQKKVTHLARLTLAIVMSEDYTGSLPVEVGRKANHK